MFATPVDLPALPPTRLAITVLTEQQLDAVISRPSTPASGPDASPGALVFSAAAQGPALTAGGAGIIASVTNSGAASTNQVMVTISFNLVPAMAVKAGR